MPPKAWDWQKKMGCWQCWRLAALTIASPEKNCPSPPVVPYDEAGTAFPATTPRLRIDGYAMIDG